MFIGFGLVWWGFFCGEGQLLVFFGIFCGLGEVFLGGGLGFFFLSQIIWTTAIFFLLEGRPV